VKSLHNQAVGRLFELTVVLGSLMERGLAQRGLTRPRATVLWHLQQVGPVLQRELSQLLGVTPRNVTAIVDALEAAGLVSREPHPRDRRATLVTLTESGQGTAAALDADREALAALLFDGVRRAELESFLATFETVLERLHKLAAESEIPT
jgi:DNA-binding MarR family transcriptional regulator